MNRQITTQIDRAAMYVQNVREALKINDPAHGLAMAAELSEIGRRLAIQFQNEIARRKQAGKLEP